MIRLKTCVLLFFSVFYGLVQAQEDIYMEVIYGKEVRLKTDTSKTVKLIPGLEYKLQATPTESVFQYIKKLTDEGEDMFRFSHARSSFLGDGIHYMNLEKAYAIFLRKKSLIDIEGKYIRIKSPIPNLEWKITRESKKILGYTCYKAIGAKTRTTLEPIKGSDGKLKIVNKTTYYIAWFTPQIPFGFGPVGFGGLPGLILELKQGKQGGYRYVATSFKMGRKPFRVKEPEKGVLISKEEYDKKLFQAVFENLKHKIVNPEKIKEIKEN